MNPLPYNITLSSQTATISYFPSREGPIETGWNSSYPSAIARILGQTQGIGENYHRTTYPGASFEFEWVGTAVYLYGKAGVGSYRFSIDGKSIESSLNDVLLGDLLGCKTDLEYGSHTVVFTTLGKGEVAFQYAEVTIGVGYNMNPIRNRTILATVGEASGQPKSNPFFQFGGSNSSKSWRPESEIYTVYHVNRSQSQIPRQMTTFEFDNTLTFTVSQTSAFFLWGTVNYDHSNKRATITWGEGRKDTLLNDLSDYLDFQQIIYWEGGLDRDKTYTVQIFNELDTHRRINSFNLMADIPWPGFSFHTLELIDGGPAPSPPTSVGPSLTAQSTRALTAGVTAGIVVGCVIVILLLGAGAYLLCRWRSNRRQNEESRYNMVLTPFQLRKGTGTRLPSSPLIVRAPPPIRATDAGLAQSMLPPEYQSDYSSPRTTDYRPQQSVLKDSGPGVLTHRASEY
ncbi:hypothetical protein PQX77_005654 [Marasmius sp. AFHP31]|nr:hypothetical protein PQX77_005654 [Marasmius sp. AFHP31]